LEGEVEKGWGEGQLLLYPGEAALDCVLKFKTKIKIKYIAGEKFKKREKMNIRGN
jgi:hypothetical protein